MSTKLYQLELDQTVVDCGMSYVFQLENGEFFIIDGGYFTPKEDERLFNFLKERCDGKPIIRGWLFTHAHQDHIGCFMDFIEKYHDEVSIDTLYYNFQPVRKHFVFGDWRKQSNDLATIKQYYKIIDKYKDRFKIHTLKTNEKFTIGELNIEVLYTADDILPKKVPFNDYSAVTKFTVNGKTILFLGDVQINGSEFLLKNQSDKLKSDIVQYAHHVFRGATIELYKAISPETALIPAPDYAFNENKDSNQVLSFVLNELGIKEYFLSANGTVEIEL